MISKNAAFTIASKSIVLLSSFFLVVLSTRIWGSEGRGEIALLLANVSVITIFTNVFCGSTIAYHAPRQKRDFLFIFSLFGAIPVSLAGAVIFSVLFGFGHFKPMFLITLLMSLVAALSSYWLGNNKIMKYNILAIMVQVCILISLIFLYFIFNKTELNSYFQSYYIGTGMVLIIGFTSLLVREPFRLKDIKYAGIKSLVSYGLYNEFNYLIQFLNYRLAYYFIAKMLSLSVLGIFSVVVSISEAVWVISRSMSSVHFSNVINSDDLKKSRNETKVYSRQSFWISLLFLLTLTIVPEKAYKIIFGNEFGDVKRFIIYLIPGIIAIAVSNLYGHYFAGKGKLNILRNKSLIGLAVTLILLPVLLKRYYLTGVCITLDVSYILSSLYLWHEFRKEDGILQP